MIQGSGLILDLHGEDKETVYGFFVNRVGQAKNADEAIAIALEELRIEVVKKYREGAAARVLEVEELKEIEAPEGSVSPQGFLLFPESSETRPWWKFWG